MTRQVRFSNNAVSKLASAITSGSTTITLQTGDGAKFPTLTGSQFFMATLIKSDGTIEVAKVTARTGDTLTVVRAAEAVGGVQTAYAFNAGDRIEHRLTAKAIGDELDRLDQAALISAQNKTANYTITAADITSLIRMNTAGGNLTVTLPDISTLTDDFDVIVAKVSADSNVVTIARSGTDTINGAATYALTNQWQGAWITADRSTGTWTVIASGGGGVKSNVDTFTGTGTPGPFTLSGDPGIKENTAVYVGGVYQQKSTYTLTGTSLTVGGNVPAGVSVEVVWAAPLQVGITSANQTTASDGSSGSLFTTVQGFITRLMSSVGSSMVGFIQAGAGAVFRWVQDKLREQVSVKDFGAKGDGVTDDTAAIQAAINYCWNTSRTLYFPAGVYLVTGLTLAGSSGQQNTMLKIVGDGFGNPFAVWSAASGSVIKSVTNAPVFQVTVPTTTTTAGTLDVQGVVFDGTSSTPVVYLQAFYGVGRLANCCVLQRGTGHGVQVDWMTTGKIVQCYVLNKDWMTSGLGSSRTGIGIYLSHKYDSGLQTIRKCTSRGFLTAYKIGVGGTTAYTYNASIENCECSVTYNGIHLTDNARATLVTNCYLEGGEGGFGIWDQGDYNKVTNCFTFAGYSTHLKSTDFTYGNVYTRNTFSAGTLPNQVLIDITSSAVSGGPGKTCSDNHLSFGGSGGSIAGVIGLRVNGTDPRINLLGNNFYPRGPWVGGAGTTKISDLSSGGVFGMTTAISGSGNVEIPMLSRGALSFEMADTGLSQLNVSGNTLTVPGGSLFYCNASSAVTVNRLSTDGPGGRFLIFNVQNANMTFANSAYMVMSGGASFASRGHIVFYTQIVGGSVYAYELCRSTY